MKKKDSLWQSWRTESQRVALWHLVAQFLTRRHLTDLFGLLVVCVCKLFHNENLSFFLSLYIYAIEKTFASSEDSIQCFCRWKGKQFPCTGLLLNLFVKLEWCTTSLLSCLQRVAHKQPHSCPAATAAAASSSYPYLCIGSWDAPSR